MMGEGRSAESGRFVDDATAAADPSHTVVESRPKHPDREKLWAIREQVRGTFEALNELLNDLD